MDKDKLIKDLRCNGLGNGTSLGHHSGLCDIAADCIEELTAQLAEKDKQLAAVIGDFHLIETNTRHPFENKPCIVCKKEVCFCSSGGSACKGFEWRGPQEAGEGGG